MNDPVGASDGVAALEKDLGEGLTLRSVRDGSDVERYVAFNTALVNSAQGVTCDYLLRHHPEAARAGFFLVEDRASGRVVSTTCLLPWHCCYEEVDLRAAMLEMVGTHPDYRRRGLIRAQVEIYHRAVQEWGFDVCIIEGIPHYYRQYGYAYAIDHWAYDSLPAWLIPDGSAQTVVTHVMRPATQADAPLLVALYRRAMSALGLWARRDESYWRFLLEWARFPVRLVCSGNLARPVGYVCVATQAGRGETRVIESSIGSADAALAVLRQLKAEGHNEIRLGWPQESTLVRLGRTLGGRSLPSYQWLVRIPDSARFLMKIGPVLEKRLARSPLAGLSATVSLNLYREAYWLHFEDGLLATVEPAGVIDDSMGARGGHINLPPEAFVRLVLGYRAVEQLRDAWPDIVIEPECRLLVDVLFPRVHSYLCTPYMYCGPEL